ncbi:hypothetical protein WJX72_003757 [[Myrmecia] bisecta]|uniref:F-box protein n=1 Tax=[Myrmecia] bisecta TaxID=41462 RepID=A0AAW1QEP6_9CHLO
MQTHPCGIQPYGNFLLQGGADLRRTGLGSLGKLSDELLQNIFGQLPAASLARLAVTSKALYCFANHEELWRALVLQELEGSFCYRQSWQQTYLHATIPGYGGCERKPLRVKGFYSDLLYQPWYCATTPLEPEWLETDNIERRSALSLEDFQRCYEIPNRPVVITDLVGNWPATKNWTRKYLRKAFKGQKVIVGSYPMDFDNYLSYADGCKEEMPLYLFDKHFAQKAPHLADDYEVPQYFCEDLFSVLEGARPDYRWLIIGPERSGSSFHKDPNSTSAWNAVVRGAKKWILYPPHITPPGVHPSADGADVATPLSLIEWFLNFCSHAQEGDVKPIECVVRSGELLFVPRGWWHMALNLEESVAVTQNYVSSINLPHVLEFLRCGREDLVSGCDMADRRSLHDRFLAKLQEKRPEVVEAMQREEEKRRQQAQEHSRLVDLFSQTSKKPASPAKQASATAKQAMLSAFTPSGVGQQPMDRTVYVGNVDVKHSDEATLRAIFENCGYVTQVRVAGKKGYNSVYAFIEYEHSSQAMTALAMNGLQLGERQIRVSMAKTLPAQQQSLENVGSDIDEQSLAEYFAACGEVTAVRLSGAAGQARRKAWIEFANLDAAKSAREYDQTELGNSHIRVRTSKTAIHTNGLRGDATPPQRSSPCRGGETTSVTPPQYAGTQPRSDHKMRNDPSRSPSSSRAAPDEVQQPQRSVPHLPSAAQSPGSSSEVGSKRPVDMSTQTTSDSDNVSDPILKKRSRHS